MTEQDPKSNVVDCLAELVDGTAPQSILDTVADDDTLRDLRHDAARAAALVRTAGDDYVVSASLEGSLAAALDARQASEPLPDTCEGVPHLAPKECDDPVAPQDVLGSPIQAELASDRARSEQPADPEEQAPDTERTPELQPEREPPIGPPLLSKVAQLVRRKAAALSNHRTLIRGAVAILAAAALLLLFLRIAPNGDESTTVGSGWHGQVVHVTSFGETGQLIACNDKGEKCRPLNSGDPIAQGSMLVTNRYARAHVGLSDGTEISLDQETRFVLDASEARSARLVAGAIVADVAHHQNIKARIEVALGQINVLGTKFALRSNDKATAVDVSRGTVELVDDQARAVMVRAGEEGLLEPGKPPSSASSQALAKAMAWSDAARQELQASDLGRGLGELVAKKPGEAHERSGAVTLATHRVKVRIAGVMARTEVEEIFTNQTDDILEGIFRFPLPADAQIERLALDVDGKLEEGAFVDRERAAAIWRGSIVNAAPQLKKTMRDEIIWVPGPWRDPALLEWQRGNRFELRIFPIPKRGSRRIILAYTQLVKPSAGVRRYTYPLAHDSEKSTRVGEFTFDLEIRGNDTRSGVHTIGYDATTSEPAPDVRRISLNERNFIPSGDLVIEYALRNRSGELTAWAYDPRGNPSSTRADRKSSTSSSDDEFPYVAIALRPQLPRAAKDERRAYAFVIDTSRSMLGESLKRAGQVAARVIRELPPDDLVTLTACDSSCVSFEDGLREPSEQLASRVERWLATRQAEGASDLTASIAAGARALRDTPGRSGRVLYIGDGTPTAGPVRPATILAAVSESMSGLNATVTALAIGSDSDLESLRAVARGGAGVVLPYVPGSTVAEAAYATLGATYGRALTDIHIQLPAGLTAVAPKQLDTLASGDETLLVARMTKAEISGTVGLSGRVGTEPFEQRYAVEIKAVAGPANAFVPRLYAATRIADLERNGDEDSKKEAIELSSRFDVASRFTSLLVLESAAMFKAFGLDNQRDFPEWSGEEEVEQSQAEGEVAMVSASSRRSGGSVTSAAAPRAPTSESSPKPLSTNSARDNRRCGCSAGDLDCVMRCAANEKAAESTGPVPMKPQTPPSPSFDEMEIANTPQVASAPRRRPSGRRSWIPMRRTWVRSGQFVTNRSVPSTAGVAEISRAESFYEKNPESRSALRDLYVLYAMSGDVRRAGELAEHWASKDPLDPGALTARADLAAREGNRETAIRILGSVVDVRPGDVGSQQRLARLHRWQGHPELGCRFSIALAEFRPDDVKTLVEAVRCSRSTQGRRIAEVLLQNASEQIRKAAEKRLEKDEFDSGLSGDFRIEAHWNDDVDVDLSILHPDGHRVSWLGAPTRSVITATDVLSREREGLALRGARAGEYVIEIVRGEGSGTVQGTLVVTLGTLRREVPFHLETDRVSIGVARIQMKEKLIEAW